MPSVFTMYYRMCTRERTQEITKQDTWWTRSITSTTTWHQPMTVHYMVVKSCRPPARLLTFCFLGNLMLTVPSTCIQGDGNKVAVRWSQKAEQTPGWGCCHQHGRHVSEVLVPFVTSQRVSFQNGVFLPQRSKGWTLLRHTFMLDNIGKVNFA